jgi:hypothetical protein
LRGKLIFFLYKERKIEKYFFNVDDSNVEQLIFKKYIVHLKNKDELRINNHYRQQLFSSLKCQTFKKNRIESLKYKKSSLISIFIDYNNCKNSAVINYEGKRKKRDLFNLTIRPRYFFSSLVVQKSSDIANGSFDFGSQNKLEWGVEMEFILPFYKNEWSIIVEVNNREYIVKDKTFDADFVTYGELTGDVSLLSLELPLGIRHYYFLNEDSKIFANLSYIFSLSRDNSLTFKRKNNSKYKKFSPIYLQDFSLGVGYNYKKILSLEMRYNINGDGLWRHNTWSTDYQILSVILGITVF